MTTPEQIAAKLTKAARRSIMDHSPEWICSWNQQGHQYLVGRGLVEWRGGNCGRLTPLGQQVRTILENRNDAG